MTAKEKVDNFMDKVEEYSASYGLISTDESPAPIADSVKQFLDYTDDDLNSLSKDDLGKMGVLCSQFAYHIQNAINIHNSRIKHTKYLIDKEIVPVKNNYSGFRDEEKRLDAIFDNSYASSLYEIQTNCEAFVERWSWFAQRLDNYVNRLASLAYGRK